MRSKKMLGVCLFVTIGLTACVTVNSPRRQMESFLDGLSIVQGRTYSLKPLAGGLTNHNYVVQFDSPNPSKMVLRVAGEEARSLGVDPGQQMSLMSKVGKLGIGPQVLATSQDQSMMLVEFFEGSHLGLQNYSAKVRKDLSQKLRILHQKAEFSTDFSPYQSTRVYLAQAENRGGLGRDLIPRERLNLAKERFLRIEQALAKRSAQFQSSCHNDLHIQNILVSVEEEVALIDWDYAGKGDLFYDLGTLSNSLELTRQQEQELLQDYFGRVSPEDEAHLQLMKLVANLWNSAWYFSQMQVPGKEEGFHMRALRYLDAFLVSAETPAFTRWLTQVERV